MNKKFKIFLLESLGKVNDIIREKGDGLSVPNSQLFNSLWKERAEYSKKILFTYLKFLGAFQKGGYFGTNIQEIVKVGECRESMVEIMKNIENQDISLLYPEMFYSFINIHPSPAMVEIMENIESMDDSLYNPEIFYFFMNLYLSPDYEPPINTGNLIYVQLRNIFICYKYFMPHIDKVYPLSNMKLDSALAKLAFGTGLFISGISHVGKKRDTVKPAIEKKKADAKSKTDKIQKLIEKIALEQDKNKRIDLIANAMKMGGFTDSRSIMNRVRDYKENA